MENVENKQKSTDFEHFHKFSNANVREHRILRTNESFALISA